MTYLYDVVLLCWFSKTIGRLLTTYGEKTDDMIKANLAALTKEFDCTQERHSKHSTSDKTKFKDSQSERLVLSQMQHGCFKPPMSSNHPEFSTRQSEIGKQQQQRTRPRNNSSWTSTNTTRTTFPSLRIQ